MRTAVIASTVPLLAGIVPCTAQDLGAADARQFIDRMVQSANDLALDADGAGIAAWIASSIAEGAAFAVQGSMVSAKGFSATYQMTLTREAMGAVSALAYGAGPLGGDAIRSYALSATVEDAAAQPGGGASVTARFTETVEMRAGEDVDTVTFHSVADCTMQLIREDGAVKAEVAVCDQVTTF